MRQIAAEKCLTIIYSICILGGAVASITVGISWSHWKTTLDQCVDNRNCSCILYGRHTPNKFLGGNLAPCVWVAFGPLFYVLYCIGLTCFHGYRVLFSSEALRTRTVMRKTEAGETIHMAVQAEDSSPLPRPFWIAVSTFAVFWAVYSLIHFAIFVDGYYRTCNQYRLTLERTLGVGGSAIAVVHGRLACQAIFDFMDYMQPDNIYGARGFINTGADLSIGLIGSFVSLFLFIAASAVNIKMAKVKY